MSCIVIGVVTIQYQRAVVVAHFILIVPPVASITYASCRVGVSKIAVRYSRTVVVALICCRVPYIAAIARTYCCIDLCIVTVGDVTTVDSDEYAGIVIPFVACSTSTSGSIHVPSCICV